MPSCPRPLRSTLFIRWLTVGILTLGHEASPRAGPADVAGHETHGGNPRGCALALERLECEPIRAISYQLLAIGCWLDGGRETEDGGRRSISRHLSPVTLKTPSPPERSGTPFSPSISSVCSEPQRGQIVCTTPATCQ